MFAVAKAVGFLNVTNAVPDNVLLAVMRPEADRKTSIIEEESSHSSLRN